MELAVAAALLAPVAAGAQTLQERLGFEADDVVLVINGDDLGMCHTSNLAVFDALEHGVLTSSSLMMPCPWVPEALQYWREHPDLDIGLHLTHTSEWGKYRWGPVASRDLVPGLIDPAGYLWHDTDPDGVYAHATPEEARIEAKAQIEMALAAGVEPTHLDSHMGVLQYRDEYWEVLLDLAEEYDLPLRIPSAEILKMAGMKDWMSIAAERGILAPTLVYGFVGPKSPEEVPAHMEDLLKQLKPGVHEIYIHPNILGPESESITGSAKMRDAEYRWVTAPETRELIDRLGIKLIGYRALRDLQRAD
jgi:chitin disaccharide deacetylase